MRRRSGIPKGLMTLWRGIQGGGAPKRSPPTQKQQITPPSGGICPKSKRNPSPRTAAHKMRRRSGIPKGLMTLWQGIQGGGAPKRSPTQNSKSRRHPAGFAPSRNATHRPEPRRIKCAAKAGFQRVSDPLAGDPRGQRPQTFPPTQNSKSRRHPAGFAPNRNATHRPEPRRIKCAAEAGFQRVS